MSDKTPTPVGAGSADKNDAEVASLATTEQSTPVEDAGIKQVQDKTMEDVMDQNENLLLQLLNVSAAMDIEGGGEAGVADSATRPREQGRTNRQERKRRREEEEKEERKRRMEESEEEREREKPIPVKEAGPTCKTKWPRRKWTLLRR